MPKKGQRMSEEHRAAISAARLGKRLAESPEKTCPKCKETKPRSDFGLRSPNAQGRRYSRSHCKMCENLDMATRARKAPLTTTEHNRKAALKRYFDMTPEQFEELNTAHGGVCSICGKPPPEGSRLHIDHDHTTGEVRGLLCPDCNQGLGRFKDSEAHLLAAIAYLGREPVKLADGTTFQFVYDDPVPDDAPVTTVHECLELIGLQLKDYRGGRTKVSVAQEIGCRRDDITMWENPRPGRKIDLSVLFSLANLYECQIGIGIGPNGTPELFMLAPGVEI